jgi:hypothetical protein
MKTIQERLRNTDPSAYPCDDCGAHVGERCRGTVYHSVAGHVSRRDLVHGARAEAADEIDNLQAQVASFSADLRAEAEPQNRDHVSH